jgi:hypothetical protein
MLVIAIKVGLVGIVTRMLARWAEARLCWRMTTISFARRQFPPALWVRAGIIGLRPWSGVRLDESDGRRDVDEATLVDLAGPELPFRHRCVLAATRTAAQAGKRAYTFAEREARKAGLID